MNKNMCVDKSESAAGKSGAQQGNLCLLDIVYSLVAVGIRPEPRLKSLEAILFGPALYQSQSLRDPLRVSEVEFYQYGFCFRQVNGRESIEHLASAFVPEKEVKRTIPLGVFQPIYFYYSISTAPVKSNKRPRLGAFAHTGII
jgi:hypothetical protein